MTQLALFDQLPELVAVRAQHGHQWQSGNYHHRNHHGFYQYREGPTGNWRFYVPWFSNDDVTCSVQVFDMNGEIQQRSGVPIDDKGRITLLGRKYGRSFWDH